MGTRYIAASSTAGNFNRNINSYDEEILDLKFLKKHKDQVEKSRQIFFKKTDAADNESKEKEILTTMVDIEDEERNVKKRHMKFKSLLIKYNNNNISYAAAPKQPPTDYQKTLITIYNSARQAQTDMWNEIREKDLTYYKEYLNLKKKMRLEAKFKANIDNMLFIGAGTALFAGTMVCFGPTLLSFVCSNWVLIQKNPFAKFAFDFACEQAFGISPMQIQGYTQVGNNLLTATNAALKANPQLSAAELFNQAFKGKNPMLGVYSGITSSDLTAAKIITGKMQGIAASALSSADQIDISIETYQKAVIEFANFFIDNSGFGYGISALMKLDPNTASAPHVDLLENIDTILGRVSVPASASASAEQTGSKPKASLTPGDLWKRANESGVLDMLSGNTPSIEITPAKIGEIVLILSKFNPGLVSDGVQTAAYVLDTLNTVYNTFGPAAAAASKLFEYYDKFMLDIDNNIYAVYDNFNSDDKNTQGFFAKALERFNGSQALSNAASNFAVGSLWRLAPTFAGTATQLAEAIKYGYKDYPSYKTAKQAYYEANKGPSPLFLGTENSTARSHDKYSKYLDWLSQPKPTPSEWDTYSSSPEFNAAKASYEDSIKPKGSSAPAEAGINLELTGGLYLFKGPAKRGAYLSGLRTGLSNKAKDLITPDNFIAYVGRVSVNQATQVLTANISSVSNSPFPTTGDDGDDDEQRTQRENIAYEKALNDQRLRFFTEGKGGDEVVQTMRQLAATTKSGQLIDTTNLTNLEYIYQNISKKALDLYKTGTLGEIFLMWGVHTSVSLTSNILTDKFTPKTNASFLNLNIVNFFATPIQKMFQGFFTNKFTMYASKLLNKLKADLEKIYADTYNKYIRDPIMTSEWVAFVRKNINEGTEWITEKVLGKMWLSAYISYGFNATINAMFSLFMGMVVNYPDTIVKGYQYDLYERYKIYDYLRPEGWRQLATNLQYGSVQRLFLRIPQDLALKGMFGTLEALKAGFGYNTDKRNPNAYRVQEEGPDPDSAHLGDIFWGPSDAIQNQRIITEGDAAIKQIQKAEKIFNDDLQDLYRRTHPEEALPEELTGVDGYRLWAIRNLKERRELQQREAKQIKDDYHKAHPEDPNYLLWIYNDVTGFAKYNSLVNAILARSSTETLLGVPDFVKDLSDYLGEKNTNLKDRVDDFAAGVVKPFDDLLSTLLTKNLYNAVKPFTGVRRYDVAQIINIPGGGSIRIEGNEFKEYKQGELEIDWALDIGNKLIMSAGNKPALLNDNFLDSYLKGKLGVVSSELKAKIREITTNYLDNFNTFRKGHPTASVKDLVDFANSIATGFYNTMNQIYIDRHVLQPSSDADLPFKYAKVGTQMYRVDLLPAFSGLTPEELSALTPFERSMKVKLTKVNPIEEPEVSITWPGVGYGTGYPVVYPKVNINLDDFRAGRWKRVDGSDPENPAGLLNYFHLNYENATTVSTLADLKANLRRGIVSGGYRQDALLKSRGAEFGMSMRTGSRMLFDYDAHLGKGETVIAKKLSYNFFDGIFTEDITQTGSQIQAELDAELMAAQIMGSDGTLDLDIDSPTYLRIKDAMARDPALKASMSANVDAERNEANANKIVDALLNKVSPEDKKILQKQVADFKAGLRTVVDNRIYPYLRAGEIAKTNAQNALDSIYSLLPDDLANTIVGNKRNILESRESSLRFVLGNYKRFVSELGEIKCNESGKMSTEGQMFLDDNFHNIISGQPSTQMAMYVSVNTHLKTGCRDIDRRKLVKDIEAEIANIESYFALAESNKLRRQGKDFLLGNINDRLENLSNLVAKSHTISSRKSQSEKIAQEFADALRLIGEPLKNSFAALAADYYKNRIDIEANYLAGLKEGDVTALQSAWDAVPATKKAVENGPKLESMLRDYKEAPFVADLNKIATESAEDYLSRLKALTLKLNSATRAREEELGLINDFINARLTGQIGSYNVFISAKEFSTSNLPITEVGPLTTLSAMDMRNITDPELTNAKETVSELYAAVNTKISVFNAELARLPGLLEEVLAFGFINAKGDFVGTSTKEMSASQEEKIAEISTLVTNLRRLKKELESESARADSEFHRLQLQISQYIRNNIRPQSPEVLQNWQNIKRYMKTMQLEKIAVKGHEYNISTIDAIISSFGDVERSQSILEASLNESSIVLNKYSDYLLSVSAFQINSVTNIHSSTPEDFEAAIKDEIEKIYTTLQNSIYPVQKVRKEGVDNKFSPLYNRLNAFCEAGKCNTSDKEIRDRLYRIVVEGNYDKDISIPGKWVQTDSIDSRLAILDILGFAPGDLWGRMRDQRHFYNRDLNSAEEDANAALYRISLGGDKEELRLDLDKLKTSLVQTDAISLGSVGSIITDLDKYDSEINTVKDIVDKLRIKKGLRASEVDIIALKLTKISLQSTDSEKTEYSSLISLGESLKQSLDSITTLQGVEEVQTKIDEFNVNVSQFINKVSSAATATTTATTASTTAPQVTDTNTSELYKLRKAELYSLNVALGGMNAVVKEIIAEVEIRTGPMRDKTISHRELLAWLDSKVVEAYKERAEFTRYLENTSLMDGSLVADAVGVLVTKQQKHNKGQDQQFFMRRSDWMFLEEYYELEDDAARWGKATHFFAENIGTYKKLKYDQNGNPMAKQKWRDLQNDLSHMKAIRDGLKIDQKIYSQYTPSQHQYDITARIAQEYNVNKEPTADELAAASWFIDINIARLKARVKSDDARRAKLRKAGNWFSGGPTHAEIDAMMLEFELWAASQTNKFTESDRNFIGKAGSYNYGNIAKSAYDGVMYRWLKYSQDALGEANAMRSRIGNNNLDKKDIPVIHLLAFQGKGILDGLGSPEDFKIEELNRLLPYLVRFEKNHMCVNCNVNGVQNNYDLSFILDSNKNKLQPGSFVSKADAARSMELELMLDGYFEEHPSADMHSIRDTLQRCYKGGPINAECGTSTFPPTFDLASFSAFMNANKGSYSNVTDNIIKIIFGQAENIQLGQTIDLSVSSANALDISQLDALMNMDMRLGLLAGRVPGSGSTSTTLSDPFMGLINTVKTMGLNELGKLAGSLALQYSLSTEENYQIQYTPSSGELGWGQWLIGNKKLDWTHTPPSHFGTHYSNDVPSVEGMFAYTGKTNHKGLALKVAQALAKPFTNKDITRAFQAVAAPLQVYAAVQNTLALSNTFGLVGGMLGGTSAFYLSGGNLRVASASAVSTGIAGAAGGAYFGAQGIAAALIATAPTHIGPQGIVTVPTVIIATTVAATMYTVANIVPSIKGTIYQNQGKKELTYFGRNAGETDDQLYDRLRDGLLNHRETWNTFINGVNSGNFEKIYDGHMRAIYEASKKQIEQNIINSYDTLDVSIRSKLKWDEPDTTIPIKDRKLSANWWSSLSSEQMRLVLTYAVSDPAAQRGGAAEQTTDIHDFYKVQRFYYNVFFNIFLSHMPLLCNGYTLENVKMLVFREFLIINMAYLDIAIERLEDLSSGDQDKLTEPVMMIASITLDYLIMEEPAKDKLKTDFYNNLLHINPAGTTLSEIYPKSLKTIHKFPLLEVPTEGTQLQPLQPTPHIVSGMFDDDFNIINPIENWKFLIEPIEVGKDPRKPAYTFGERIQSDRAERADIRKAHWLDVGKQHVAETAALRAAELIRVENILAGFKQEVFEFVKNNFLQITLMSELWSYILEYFEDFKQSGAEMLQLQESVEKSATVVGKKKQAIFSELDRLQSEYKTRLVAETKEDDIVNQLFKRFDKELQTQIEERTLLFNVYLEDEEKLDWINNFKIRVHRELVQKGFFGKIRYDLKLTKQITDSIIDLRDLIRARYPDGRVSINETEFFEANYPVTKDYTDMILGQVKSNRKASKVLYDRVLPKLKAKFAEGSPAYNEKLKEFEEEILAQEKYWENQTRCRVNKKAEAQKNTVNAKSCDSPLPPISQGGSRKAISYSGVNKTRRIRTR